ncbi:hypothetical protein SAMN05421505_12025 [Sinosporangium album]|uniref:Uncharacterized protein n=1 Tax=Sinosporangium album TaxID=504805 RepID=A0A1G8EBB4_9ACTN|nr:hypothetical protein [Sinosporangium album]SDH67222.1 hypothetical protein SAMN05421505_12025 [Sinosporangium album]
MKSALAPTGAELHHDVEALYQEILTGGPDAAYRATRDQLVHELEQLREEVAGLRASAQTPPKVYLAIAGEHGDRQIQVFARQEDAEAYDPAHTVQEREVSFAAIDARTWHKATWVISVPGAFEQMFDLVNAFPTQVKREVRDFDGEPDEVAISWWKHPEGLRPWVVEFECWNQGSIRAAWQDLRGRIIASGGAVESVLKQPPYTRT